MSNNERISTKKRRPSTRTIKPPVGTPPLDSDLIYPDVMFAPDGTIIPKTYTAADVKRAINPDDPSSYDFSGSFTPEFIEVYEAACARQRKAFRESSWVNPDAKEQPSYINGNNRMMACWLKVTLASDNLADGYRNWTFAEAAEECGWTGKVLIEAHQLAKDMGLLKKEKIMEDDDDDDDDDDSDGVNVGNSKGQTIGHKKRSAAHQGRNLIYSKHEDRRAAAALR
jgi:hypothetical protein